MHYMHHGKRCQGRIGARCTAGSLRPTILDQALRELAMAPVPIVIAQPVLASGGVVAVIAEGKLVAIDAGARIVHVTTLRL